MLHTQQVPAAQQGTGQDIVALMKHTYKKRGWEKYVCEIQKGWLQSTVCAFQGEECHGCVHTMEAVVQSTTDLARY